MNIINVSRIKCLEDINLKENRTITSEDDFNIVNSDNTINKDHLTISEESKKILKDKKALMLEEVEEQFHLIENFKEEMKASNDDENPYTIELKCLLISLRIISGDEVPQKDKSFLMEHKPEMYGNAILLRRINKDPKKYKSLIGDEGENDIEELCDEMADLISKVSSEESTSTKDMQSSEIAVCD